MASRLENLNAAMDNMAARLAEMTTSPKPSYDFDGQRFNWMEYQRFLVEAMAGLRTQIEKEDDALYVEDTQAYTSPALGAHRAQFPMGRDGLTP